MNRLLLLAVAALLAAPDMASAQFRPIIISPVGGLGGPGFYGWPGYGGYNYPYTFGGMGNYSWPGYGMGYGSSYTYTTAPTSTYSIPNVGTPLPSLGGLPTRWNGVDLTGTGNQATSFNAYLRYGGRDLPWQIATPRSGTLPAANTADVSSDLRAHVHVRLPAANGRVWFEGRSVPVANGAGRFASPPLDPGSRYVYEVRARWTDAAGRQHNAGRSVTVRAGEHVDVNFVAPDR